MTSLKSKIFTRLLIKVIRVYQKIFSPDKGLLRWFYPNNKGHCRMYPSCSEYMVIAIQKYGIFRGLLKGSYRILRCNPFQKKFIDLP